MAAKLSRRDRIKKGIRKHLSGSTERPRLSVFRSNKGIYAQVIDDVNGKTIVSASSLSKDFSASGTKGEQSAAVGKLVAQKAIAAGITAVVFDRNGYLYHGRVKQLAEGAREGGLKF
ncbi:50S ribosomal protein L18 [Mucilaginibacter polytrichastri]|jgi:large subunit ribosomal protein L18|uniref:Large ribosomal subunit protein uL18 n=1 Tax=Mucilaginibacter polytrichastri TaxID=1302689 RepID=A0A1Q5ZSG1_9SPHI|nr:50S ribosomal protein L18 [Mucilaginibacter polytrichastri]OKS84705.1 50S ribosomal protein L18 [Mucilaginibacter polytrichastri]SFT01324.1 LSU ribosomal protein L18P [Mucilaginibacter polytrichastri]